MADSVYTLAVRLALEAPTIGTVAGMAMRHFGQLETSAKSLDKTIKGMRFDIAAGAATNSMPVVRAQASELMNIYRNLHMANMSVGGVSAFDLTQGFSPYIQAVDKAQQSVDKWTQRMTDAESRVKSLNRAIQEIKIVNPERGVPNTFMTAGGTATTQPIANNAMNRRYAYLLSQYKQALGERDAARNFQLNPAMGPNARNPTGSSAFQLLSAQRQLEAETLARAGHIDTMQRKAQERFNRGQNMVMAGSMGLFGGLMVKGMVTSAVQDAAQYELVQAQVGQAMKGGLGRMMTPNEQSDLRQSYLDIGQPRGFDMTQMASVALGLTKVGLNRPDLIRQILPTVTDFAEVMARTRHMDPGAAAEQGGEFAHLFGAVQSPQEITKLFDMLNKTLVMVPIPAKQLHTNLSYFAGQLRQMEGIHLMDEPARFGVPAAKKSSQAKIEKWMEDALSLESVIAYLGQQGRAGSQMSALLQSFIGKSSARSAAQVKVGNAIQAKLGIPLWDKEGNFRGAEPMLELLQAMGQTKDPHRALMATQLFTGAVGGHMASNLGADTIKQMQSLIKSNFKNINDIATYRGALTDTGVGEYAKLQAALKNLNTIVGLSLLPTLTKVASVAQRMVATFDNFANNPIGGFFVGLAANIIAVAGAVAILLSPLAILRGSLWMLGTNGKDVKLFIKGLGLGFKDFFGLLRAGMSPMNAMRSAFPLLGRAISLITTPIMFIARLLPTLGGWFLNIAGIVIRTAPVWSKALGIIGLAISALIIIWQNWDYLVKITKEDIQWFIDRADGIAWLFGKIGEGIGGASSRFGTTIHDAYNPSINQTATKITTGHAGGETFHAINKLQSPTHDAFLSSAALRDVEAKTRNPAAVQKHVQAHGVGQQAAKHPAAPPATQAHHMTPAQQRLAAAAGQNAQTITNHPGAITIHQNFGAADALDPRKIKKATQDALSEAFTQGSRHQGTNPFGLQVGRNGK